LKGNRPDHISINKGGGKEFKKKSEKVTMASNPDEKLWTEKLVGKKIVDEPTSDPQVSFKLFSVWALYKLCLLLLHWQNE